jgi:hypothetical protein
MGRELKRVPINFEWEIGKLWCGYINPHEVHECKECNGSGYSKEYQKLHDEWYSFDNADYKPNPFRKDYRYNAAAWSNNLTKDDVKALLKADRLWDFTRVPINDEQKEIVKQKIADGGNSWLPFNNGYVPTPKEVNEWNLKGLGHDSSNAWYCVKARLKREGKPYECSKCKGTGENWQHPKAKSLYKNWKSYDPPTGDGFQLWTTTTEGSPMTPVFSSLEELCDYCEKEKVSVFGSSTATKEKWFKMLDDGFVYHKEGNAIFV